MEFVYRDNLKIELKAVLYGPGIYHHLMYRISPDQDLTYYKEYSILGFKFKLKKKFSTKWRGAYKYLNYPSAYLYEEEPVQPVLLKCDSEFFEWKRSCSTMKDFFDKLGAIDNKELAEWRRDREEFLNNNKIWN